MPDYGDDFATATTVSFPTSLVGEMRADNNVDFIRIVPTPGADFISIDYFGVNYYRLQIFDSSQTQLYNEPGGFETYNIFPPFDSEYFIKITPYNATNFGYYYINIFEFTDNSGDPLFDSIEDRTESQLDDFFLGIDILANGNFKEKYETPYMFNSYSPANSFDVSETPIHHQIEFTYPPGFNKPKVIINNTRSHEATNRFIVPVGVTRYVVEGKVTVLGAAAPERMVRLYDRQSGELIDQTKTDTNGNYKFTTYVSGDHKYYVIAFDDMDAPELQAVVHDALIPIEKV